MIFRAIITIIMYVAVVALFMFILPIVSILIESLVYHNHSAILALIGKWFVFWGVGIRLFTAGLRQVAKPELTAKDILGIKDKQSWLLVQELGFANISIGLIGICTIFKPEWLLPAALAGGLFYGLAGFRHIFKKKNFEENVATYSDLFMFIVMAIYFVGEINK